MSITSGAIGRAGAAHLSLHYAPITGHMLDLYTESSDAVEAVSSGASYAHPLHVAIKLLKEHYKVQNYLIAQYIDMGCAQKGGPGSRHEMMIIPRKPDETFDSDSIWEILDKEYINQGAKSHFCQKVCPAEISEETAALRGFLRQAGAKEDDAGLTQLDTVITGGQDATGPEEDPWKFGRFGVPEEQIFFQTNHVVAIVNIRSFVEGHSLVVARRKVDSPDQLTREEMADLLQVGHLIAYVLHRIYKSTCVSLGIQTGKDAGQTVPHTHIHICPIPIPGAPPFPYRTKTPEEMKTEGALMKDMLKTVKAEKMAHFSHLFNLER